MEGGMYVSKHIHLDEQLVAYFWIFVQPFPHEVSTRTSWSFALLFCIRVVRGERAGTPSSPYFYIEERVPWDS